MFPYGHEERSFDSITEQGLAGGQKFSTQYQEVVVFFQKNFPQKVPLDT